MTGVKRVQQDASPDRASGRNVFKCMRFLYTWMCLTVFYFWGNFGNELVMMNRNETSKTMLGKTNQCEEIHPSVLYLLIENELLQSKGKH